MNIYFSLSRVELTATGIALVGPDESRVELCGRDVGDLIKWLNWHVIELWERREIEGPDVPPEGLKESAKKG